MSSSTTPKKPRKPRAPTNLPWSEHPSNAEALKAQHKSYYQLNKERIKANTRKRYYEKVRPVLVKSLVNIE